jgi:FlaA1/EpsC-like NDP-sugar epimerase
VWPADVLAVGLAIVVVALVQALGIDELQPARSGLILPVLTRLARRRWLIVVADLGLVIAAQAGALALGGHPVLTKTSAAESLAIVAVVHLAAFHLLGVYRTVWWASGAADLGLLARACAAGTCFSYILLRLSGVPATPIAAVIRFLFLLPVVAATRLSPAILANAVRRAGRAERAVICGTDAEAQHAITHLRRNGMRNVEPIGFVEMVPRLQGRQLGRLPVLGTLDGLMTILRTQSVGHVVIADPQLRGEALRWARAVCRHSGVRFHRYIERLLHESGTEGGGAPERPTSVPAMAATGTEGPSR